MAIAHYKKDTVCISLFPSQIFAVWFDQTKTEKLREGQEVGNLMVNSSLFPLPDWDLNHMCRQIRIVRHQI
jgi:hypothetical protein